MVAIALMLVELVFCPLTLCGTPSGSDKRVRLLLEVSRVDSTSVRWIWVGYNHLISNKCEWNNCFIKNALKISRILPDFTCKNNRFSAWFKFWADAYSYRIRRAWYNGSYTMMAKPIRALELHYPMIQFLIMIHSWLSKK